MIAYLKGFPKILTNKLIVQTGGVGYRVAVSHKVFNSCQPDKEVELFIYTHVKEDRFELYGFLTHEEQQLFELVLSVSGIGPSTALAILNKNPEQLVTAVQEADINFFKSVPRVGKKMAQKIIIELGGKLGKLKEINLTPLNPKQQNVADALIALGWEEDQLRSTLETIDVENISEQEAIKQALQLIKT